jgi:hypothetical protein
VHDVGGQQAGWLAEVDELDQVRVAEHHLRLPQVHRNHGGGPAAFQQPAGMRSHHRVDVYVHHPGAGDDPAHGLVGVVLRGQARSEVDELGDPLACHPDRRAAMKTPVGQHCVERVRGIGLEHLGHLPVDREVGRAAQ